MITNLNTNMNSTMKTGAERAERSEASEGPPLHRHDYEYKHEHDYEYEFHNENGCRASRAKRGERGTPPYTDLNTNKDHFLATFRKWSSLKPDPSLLGLATGIIFFHRESIFEYESP